MSWKQPIPTDIKDNPNLTSLEVSVFCYIMLFVRNEDGLEQFIHANKHYSQELKRGQCIFKVSKYANEHKIDRKRITRSIGIISKWYTEMDTIPMPFGLIVTIKDYDNIIKMDNGMDSERTVRGQLTRALKSVKTNKTTFKSADERRTVTPVMTEEEILREKGGHII